MSETDKAVEQILETIDPVKAVIDKHQKEFGSKSLTKMKEALKEQFKEHEERRNDFQRRLDQYGIALIFTPQNKMIMIDIRNTTMAIESLDGYMNANQQSIDYIDTLLTRDKDKG